MAGTTSTDIHTTITDEHGRPPAPVFDMMNTTFFLGREMVMASKQPDMMIWREKLFAVLSRNASSATDYFCLPPNRVVELGSQVEI